MNKKILPKLSSSEIIRAIHNGRIGKYSPKTKSYREMTIDDLGGLLKSNVKLTSRQLRKARDSFSRNWAKI